MKQIMIAIVILFSLTGCGGDNAYDGVTGLPSSTSSTSSVEGLYTVLISDSNVSLQKAEALVLASKELLNTRNEANLQTTQDLFNELINAWKPVQALYVADEIDSSMVYTESYIDFWHYGNTDVKAELDAIFAGNSDLSATLKTSHKTISALEYTLFGHSETRNSLVLKFNENTQRRAEALVLMAESVSRYNKDIAEFYATDTDFLRDDEASVENLVNQLIDSSYKLKEWRVGESAGLVVKYANDPDASRLEYFDSALSAEGITAILKSHKNLFEPDEENGLSAYMNSKDASSEASYIVSKIQEAIAAVNNVPKPMKTSVPSTELTALYTALSELHDAYYISLVNALNIVPALLEADGD